MNGESPSNQNKSKPSDTNSQDDTLVGIPCSRFTSGDKPILQIPDNRNTIEPDEKPRVLTLRERKVEEIATQISKYCYRYKPLQIFYNESERPGPGVNSYLLERETLRDLAREIIQHFNTTKFLCEESANLSKYFINSKLTIDEKGVLKSYRPALFICEDGLGAICIYTDESGEYCGNYLTQDYYKKCLLLDSKL